MAYFGNYGGFTPQGYTNPYTTQTPPTMQTTALQPITNKIYVTSGDDALNRFAQPNSVTMYVQQDEMAIFEVATDQQGRKSIKTFTLTPYTAPTADKTSTSEYVLRTEFESLQAEIKALKSKITKSSKVVGAAENE